MHRTCVGPTPEWEWVGRGWVPTDPLWNPPPSLGVWGLWDLDRRVLIAFLGSKRVLKQSKNVIWRCLDVEVFRGAHNYIFDCFGGGVPGYMFHY